MPPKLEWNIGTRYSSEILGRYPKFFTYRNGVKVDIEVKDWLDYICGKDKKKMEQPKKILIMQDKENPNHVIAKDLDTGKTAKAKCAPGDIFDFYEGAKLALDRLTNKDEKPKLWTGKVVCTKYDGWCNCFTVGKVYSVNNGVLLDNENNPKAPYATGIKDINSMRHQLFDLVDFVEYKGENA